MIEIDGSFGEGGGQILRTALSLSCLFRKPFRMFNIRKGRRKPGLMPQHITCVRSAQLISNAIVNGDHMGSLDLVFRPDEVAGGDFLFDIGTAGSTMLVLQTLVPSLAFSNNRTSVILKGGTHVPFSPSYHYMKEIFLPFLERLGVRMILTIESYGFYPRGGGVVRAEVMPMSTVRPLSIAGRGGIVSLTGCSGAGNLPLSIAERQRDGLTEKLDSSPEGRDCSADIEVVHVPTPGQGTFIFLKAETENSFAGFSAVGQRGKRAELVGEEAADEFLQYYRTGAALDPYLADQIVLYLSLCKEESAFTTSRITRHLETNLRVIGLFHDYRYSFKGETGGPGEVQIFR